MKYTVRYAHLEHIPELKKNQLINRGDKIGRIGNTGTSTGTHLHIDCVESYVSEVFHMWEIDQGAYKSNPIELNYFIDFQLFNTKIHITSSYFDPFYMAERGILHPAYDVVPLNRHETKKNYDIFWNRSFKGKVLSLGKDDGYGNYINIGYNK